MVMDVLQQVLFALLWFGAGFSVRHLLRHYDPHLHRRQPRS